MVAPVLFLRNRCAACYTFILTAWRSARSQFPGGKSHWLRRGYQLQFVLVWTGVIGLVCVTFLGNPIFGLLLAAVLVAAFRQGRKAADTEYGSARWGTVRDQVDRGYLCGRTGLVVGRLLPESHAAKFPAALAALWRYPRHADELAVRVFRSLRSRKSPRPLILLPDQEIVHMSVYGRSGSSKSQGSVIPNLFLDPSAVIAVDVKGELAAATARQRAEVFGHEVVCIAPFGGQPTGFKAESFNPLSAVNLKSPHLVSDAIHFAKALIRPDRHDHNPFFAKSAIVIIDAVLSFLFCHAAPCDCTLQKLREITVDPAKLQQLAELMQQSNFAGGYLRSKGQQLASLTGKTLLDVLATLNTQLFWIDSLAVEQATLWTTFSLQKLLDGQMTIYLIFPTDRVEDYGPLIRVWITAFAHAIFSAGIGRTHPIRFYFDEASLLGRDMPVLERMLTKGRGYGIKTNFYWQSVQQIQEVFPEHQAQVFREQMSVEQFLEVATYQSAKEISQWIGQTTIRVDQQSHTSGWSHSETISAQPSWSRSWSDSTTVNQQKTGRALIQPEELLQLPADVTVILKPQCPPLLAEKLQAFRPEQRTELEQWPSGTLPCDTPQRRQRWALAVLVLLTVILLFAACALGTR